MPYDIRKQGSQWYIYYKGTNRKAVKKGYDSKSEAQRVARLRVAHGD